MKLPGKLYRKRSRTTRTIRTGLSVCHCQRLATGVNCRPLP